MLLSPILCAEVVTLRTGKIISGEIVLQNDEVLIIRTKNGSKYQYPAAEVLSVKADEIASLDAPNATKPPRKLAVHLQTAGGAVCVPEIGWGGQFAADLMLGTRTIHGTRIFLGAGLGYRAKVMDIGTYSFLPLQAVVAMPLSKHKHAPFLGMSIGYGIALNKQTQGGIFAGAEVGWNYQISDKTDFLLALCAEVQQAKTDVMQTVNDVDYLNHIGCNFVTLGLKLAVNL